MKQIKSIYLEKLSDRVYGSFQVVFSFILGAGVFFRENPDLMRKLIVVLAPYFLILTSGFDWMFGNYSVDPYNYSAIFLNFADPEFFANGYKFGRLPWVLSGYIAFSIFSPKVATILLISSFFSFALLGMYIFIRNMLNYSTAFFITIALAFFAPFHSLHSGGVFYHNLSSATFLIWSFAFLSRVFNANQKKSLCIFYGGLFAALALHCNITVINFLPLYLVFFCLMDERKTLKSLFRSSIICLGGALVITLVLMILNWCIRGDFFFYKDIVRLAKSGITDSNFQKPWWESWSTLWFLKKRHALVLSGIYFDALAVIPFMNTWSWALRSKNGHKALYCVGQYIFLFTLWIFWQTEGQTALNIDYFSYPLIIPAFICLGGLVFLVTKGNFSISSKWYWILPLIYLGTAVSGIGLYVKSETIAYLYLIIPLLIFSIIFCRKNKAALLWVILLAFVCAANNDQANYKIKSHSSSSNVDFIQAVIKAQQYISSIARWKNISVFYSSAEYALDQDKNKRYFPVAVLNVWPSIVNVWGGGDLFTSENVYSNQINSSINDNKTLIVITQNETNYPRIKKLYNENNADIVEIANYPLVLKNDLVFNIKSFKIIKNQSLTLASDNDK